VTAAVVTGAAGDLGGALSEALLADGYRVYGGDVAPVAPRSGLVPVHLDVTERASTFALAERAAAEAGRAAAGGSSTSARCPARSAAPRCTRPTAPRRRASTH